MIANIIPVQLIWLHLKKVLMGTCIVATCEGPCLLSTVKHAECII